MNRTTRILLVNDDRTCLRMLKKILAPMQDCEVDAFTSANIALEKAIQAEYDIVISDYMMPEMDGITFLKQYMKSQPRTSRIILSSYCTKESLYGAVNEAQVLRYIEKPCNEHALRSIIGQVIKERTHTRPISRASEMLSMIQSQEQIISHQAREIDRLKYSVA
ncbi:MAG: hypothetical protein COB71_09310 [Thiotrichales bacterium]|nr:MAG: hypothetical protein COB71_12530 [Thiotrichales bacterium]PCI12332.1 MAG: hypothetical protein COB71_09310 [Thiotrichales bacterium]